MARSPDAPRPRPLALALALALVLAWPASPTLGSGPASTSATFARSDAPIANPERGFYAPADLLQASEDAFAAEVRAGRTLLHAYVRLDPYVASDLPASLLERLDAGFAAVRRAGAKAIPRFTYTFPEDLTDPAQIADAPIERVLRHIGQLAPVLQRNADVIAFLQAGFVGAWGEWHTSGSGLDAPANAARIRDALLAAMPQERSVMFRRPSDLLDWYGPARPDAPRDGGPRARSGLHNDCFLSGATDAGTYPPARPGLRDDVRRRVAQVPFGGETCDVPPPRGRCADILREGREYGVTYLNAAFFRPAFHDRWRTEGCLAEVERSLGHRLRLESATLPREAARGTSLRIALAVRNDGWARPHNPRDVVVVLLPRGGGPATALRASGVDPRDWGPTHAATPAHAATLAIEVPRSLAPGDYDVALALPDPAPSLSGDPRYAIRPANADVPSAGQRWDRETGRFRTGLILSIR
jgi:hypothetical protein